MFQKRKLKDFVLTSYSFVLPILWNIRFCDDLLEDWNRRFFQKLWVRNMWWSPSYSHCCSWGENQPSFTKFGETKRFQNKFLQPWLCVVPSSCRSLPTLSSTLHPGIHWRIFPWNFAGGNFQKWPPWILGFFRIRFLLSEAEPRGNVSQKIGTSKFIAILGKNWIMSRFWRLLILRRTQKKLDTIQFLSASFTNILEKNRRFMSPRIVKNHRLGCIKRPKAPVFSLQIEVPSTVYMVIFKNFQPH